MLKYANIYQKEIYMTEKRLLSFVITEGILVLLLGFCVLILPKITDISFGFMLCLAFIIYGGYRIISSIMTKNYSGYFIFNLIAGLILFTVGILLFFAHNIDVMLIISMIGIYFILTSISVSAFGIRGEGIISSRKLIFMLSALEILLGVLVLTTVSSSALWLAGILAGLDFLISGVVFVNVFLSSDNKII